jgi:hypothetical protein
MCTQLILALSMTTPKIDVSPWTSDLKAAYARARKENKPVLHLQLMGRLDDAFC